MYRSHDSLALAGCPPSLAARPPGFTEHLAREVAVEALLQALPREPPVLPTDTQLAVLRRHLGPPPHRSRWN